MFELHANGFTVWEQQRGNACVMPRISLTLVLAWLLQTSKSGWKVLREFSKPLLIKRGDFPHYYSRYNHHHPRRHATMSTVLHTTIL